MKKILTIIALMACMIMPLAAFGMTPVTDSELSAVTGQAGVSIAADVTMNIGFDTIAWGDSDGIGGTTTGGWVGFKDGAIDNLRLHLRSDAGMADLAVAYVQYGAIGGSTYTTQGDFNTAVAGGAGTTDNEVATALAVSIIATNQFLTIDVYTPAVGKTAVRIGIPTLEIDMASFDTTTGTWTNVAGKPGVFSEYGSIYMGNMVALLGKDNYIDIAPNDTTAGVMITVGNKGTGNLIDSLDLAVFSWGDKDGLISGDPAGAGFVGVTGFNITALKLAASLNINVATATGAGIPAMLGMDFTDPATMDTLRALLAANNAVIKDDLLTILSGTGAVGATVVDIALTASLSIGEMSGTCKVGNAKTLAGAGASTYGQFYLKNLTLDIPTGGGAYAASWVAIGAH